jgi:NAD(P)-dependent dehydrogenase (short-subunit alcohol dehydrogenase family)
MSQNKPVALVTGANQGIGLQIVKELAKHGFTVYLGARSLDRGQAAADTVDGDARAIQLDVTDRGSVERAAEQIASEQSRLDVLINNAAVSRPNHAAGMDYYAYGAIAKASIIPVADVREIWDTNVFGVITVTQLMLPLLRKAPAARIVNVSSGLGSLTVLANPEWSFRSEFNPGYGASKTALNAITMAFAFELEAEGIKVNAVSPGQVNTALNSNHGTETVEEGAAEAVRVALLGTDGPTATFTHTTFGPIPW